MTNIAMVFRWPIKVDGLPFLKMVDLSMAMLNNQMVCSGKHTKKYGKSPATFAETPPTSAPWITQVVHLLKLAQGAQPAMQGVKVRLAASHSKYVRLPRNSTMF